MARLTQISEHFLDPANPTREMRWGDVATIEVEVRDGGESGPFVDLSTDYRVELWSEEVLAAVAEDVVIGGTGAVSFSDPVLAIDTDTDDVWPPLELTVTLSDQSTEEGRGRFTFKLPNTRQPNPIFVADRLPIQVVFYRVMDLNGNVIKDSDTNAFTFFYRRGKELPAI